MQVTLVIKLWGEGKEKTNWIQICPVTSWGKMSPHPGHPHQCSRLSTNTSPSVPILISSGPDQTPSRLFLLMMLPVQRRAGINQGRCHTAAGLSPLHLCVIGSRAAHQELPPTARKKRGTVRDKSLIGSDRFPWSCTLCYSVFCRHWSDIQRKDLVKRTLCSSLPFTRHYGKGNTELLSLYYKNSVY